MRNSASELQLLSPLVDHVVDAIVKSAQSGKVGDGKIFAMDLGQVVRVRTGERDASAL